MRMGLRKTFLAMTMGLATACLPAAFVAADDKKTDKKPDDKKPESKSGGDAKDEKKSLPPGKLPDFSKQFANAGEMAGVVVSADPDSITIRLNYRATSGGRNTKEAHKDIEFKYAEGALARTKVAPTKVDAKGKFVKVPASELEPLKKPQGAPGWHIDRGDIAAGAIVTLELLRPKSIPASKVSMDDKVIKFAVVTGETTPPSLSWDEKQKQKEKNQKKEKKP